MRPKTTNSKERERKLDLKQSPFFGLMKFSDVSEKHI